MQKMVSTSWVILFVVTSILFFCNSVAGQSLKRSAFLGAQLMDLSAVEEETGADFGLYLPMILPEGSLGEMGVPAKSVLQKINGFEIKSFQDIQSALSPIKEGNNLEVVVLENGKTKTYKGLAVGKPKEKHTHASIDYGVVRYAGNTLRYFLYLPNEVENPPVVFFLQGYTCQSIEMRDNNPAKQLINQWIEKGYAVYLVEKPGMGDSESAIPCMDIDFNQELLAFTKAYEALQNNPKIDNQNIFLFGHSMGGIIAPLLAQKTSPAGIMVYGIVGERWYDYMKRIYTEQPLIFGNNQEQINQDAQYYLPFVKDLLVHKKSNSELLKSPIYGERLKQDGVADNLANGYYIMRHYKYWQTLADVDVPGIWAKVKAPVYVLHGEYDIQAIHPKYGEMIVTNVNQNGGNAQFELMPKAEHAFLHFDSREEHLNTLNGGGYVAAFTTNFNPTIGEKCIEWMNQQRK
ncbi:MAG TPA: alpha/beta fold hydrolase [Flavobacteriaceae bacterium]|nr:alpha/beta fold hydrolase [Flavobacteriaceae bacterium]